MSDRLPPLTALRAFEAAARHLSFQKAAHELSVTPAALSFQIKSLEAHLGAPLFHRLNRAVDLTEAGRALAPGTSDGFAALAAAWRQAQRTNDGTILTVTAGPGITSKWLAPRMYDFAQRHPGIELRFSASLRIMDFDRDEVDVALRFGLGGESGLYARDLLDDWITPMMTPAVHATYPQPGDLSAATLLYQDTYPFGPGNSDWDHWFRIQGADTAPRGGPRFSQGDHALDAAMAGLGVVLGRYSMAETALRSGQLVAPYDTAIMLPSRHRFVCRDGQQTRPHIAAFERWIVSEIEQMQDFSERFDFVDLEPPQ